jgi:hypothetical protein
MRTTNPILSYINPLKIDLNRVIGLYFYNLQQLRIFMSMAESWYVFCLSKMWNETGYGEGLLLRNRPQRNYIELGEVWIRPKPRMSRYFVESMLREKAARMGADALVITVDEYFRDHVAVRRYRRGTMAYYERLILGVAIRFR